MKIAIFAAIFSALYFGIVIKIFGNDGLKPAYIMSQFILGLICLDLIRKIKKSPRRKVWKSQPDWPEIEQRYEGIQSAVQGKTIPFNKIVKRCLNSIETEGSLAGDQFFCIIFEKNFKGVEIPQHLLAGSQTSPLINIELGLQGFQLTQKEGVQLVIKLRVNSEFNETIIPYDAIRTFADPSVGFAITRQSPAEW